MNIYDFENQTSRQKDFARRAGEAYWRNHILKVDRAAPNDRTAPLPRRILAGFGGALVAIGYRLQGEIDQLAIIPERPEPLAATPGGCD